MRVLIVIIAVLFSESKINAQINFVPNDSAKYSSFKLDSLLNKSATIDGNFDFEFRLWTLSSLISYSNVFILRNENGNWSARYFDYQNGEFHEQAVEQLGLDTLWLKISNNKVLTLPPQDSLRTRMRKYYADTSYVLNTDGEYSSMYVTDGTEYRFALYKNKLTRTFEYHCPASYLNYFSNIEELFRAYAIIILIKKHLKLPLIVC